MSCLGVIIIILPKFTYNTEWGSIEFSHSTQPGCSFHRLEPIDFNLLSPSI